MTDTTIRNDNALDAYCRALAEEIAAEAAETGADPLELASEAVDGCEHVIYYAKVHEICKHCDTSRGAEWLADAGITATSYDEHATILAYGEIYCRVAEALAAA